MKNNTPRLPVPSTITEDDIRDYAYHLYEQGNCQSGNDLAHWFEATAFLHTNATGHRPRPSAASIKA